MTENPLDDLITPKTAAEILNVSRQNIYLLIDKKLLNKVEVDGVVFVSRSEVTNFTPPPAGRPPKNRGM